MNINSNTTSKVDNAQASTSSPSPSTTSPDSSPFANITIEIPSQNETTATHFIKKSPSSGYISSTLTLNTRTRAVSGSSSSSSSPPSPKTFYSANSPHSPSSPLACPSPPSPHALPPRRLTSSTGTISSQNTPTFTYNPNAHPTHTAVNPFLTHFSSLPPPITEIEEEHYHHPWSVNFLGSEIRLDPSFSAYAVRSPSFRFLS